MQENRNTPLGLSQDRGCTVCIDTRRVLDSCRDRDCFEDTRVYLTCYGEEVLASATNIRTKSAEIIWAFVGVNDVPFNSGFFQVTVRYYIAVELEACLGIGRSQCIKGIAVLEKDVILYGGEGDVTSFSSNPENNFCSVGNPLNVSTNSPIAVVDTVEPVILGTKVKECGCHYDCDCLEIPENVRCCMDGELVTASDGPRLFVSFGIFSVIRIERPAQLLVQATDYSVPDKECCSATNNDNPCDLFRTISFPASRFRGTTTATVDNTPRSGGCGCSKNN